MQVDKHPKRPDRLHLYAACMEIGIPAIVGSELALASDELDNALGETLVFGNIITTITSWTSSNTH